MNCNCQPCQERPPMGSCPPPRPVRPGPAPGMPIPGPGPALDSMMPAMAYVPWQRWGQTYAPEQAIGRGTLFPELDLPFLAARGCR